MKHLTKIIALVLAVAMCVCVFAACKKPGGNDPTKTTDPAVPASTDAPAADDTALVVGYSNFNEKFSPFFSETAYDQDVWAMTAISLLTSDRTGAVVQKGIEGEKISYNGTE